MACLFQTETKNTMEEYKRFWWTLFMQRKPFIRYGIYELILFVSGFFLKNVFLFAFGVIYPIILAVLFILQNRHIEKAFESNTLLRNADIHFAFYDTYFVEMSEAETAQIEYSQLQKIIETKTNFYFMVSKNQGIILNKANFPEGLAEFIRKISYAI